jgi:hypothetical protein
MPVFAAPPLGFPVLRLLSWVCMPSSLPRQDGWKLFAPTLPVTSAFPTKEMGRLLHCGFRGLLNVHSRYSLHTHGVAYTTLSTEGFSRFVASTTASVVTGWNEPVPGRVYLPLKKHRLSTAHSFDSAPSSAVPDDKSARRSAQDDVFVVRMTFCGEDDVL